MTNLIAIANRKLNFSNWIKWIQGQIQYGQSNMINHDYAGVSQRGFYGELIPSHQVESPLVLDQGTQHLPLSMHVHVPPACRHLCLPPYREGKAWNTKQSSPES